MAEYPHDDALLRKNFPLFPTQQYDFFYENAPWPVGLRSDAPSEVKKRIAAAYVSVFMGLKSVDWVLKRYLSEKDYPESDGDRLDLRVERAVREAMSKVRNAILLISSLGDKRIGQAIGEWTILRADFSMGQILVGANQGALFEPLAIARMMLEQLAWAAAAAEEIVDERVSEISAQASIGILKRVIPVAGRLYGWLSQHAHWRFEAHIKSFVIERERTGHLFASYRFKAIALAASLALSATYVRYIQSLLDDVPSRGSEIDASFEGLTAAYAGLLSHFYEIRQLMPGDEDIASLGLIFD